MPTNEEEVPAEKRDDAGLSAKTETTDNHEIFNGRTAALMIGAGRQQDE